MLSVYAEQGAVKWAQENPNYLEVYRYGEERRVQGHLGPRAEPRRERIREACLFQRPANQCLNAIPLSPINLTSDPL